MDEGISPYLFKRTDVKIYQDFQFIRRGQKAAK